MLSGGRAIGPVEPIFPHTRHRGYDPSMSDERKPVWPWIVAPLIGLPVLYVVSFGPACWMGERMNAGVHAVSIVYRPIIRFTHKSSHARRVALRYASLGMTNGRSPVIVNDEIDWSGNVHDSAALMALIQSTVKPDTGELLPIDDSDVATEHERIEGGSLPLGADSSSADSLQTAG